MIQASSRFAQLVSVRDDAHLVRLEARAKEAKLLQLLTKFQSSLLPPPLLHRYTQLCQELQQLAPAFPDTGDVSKLCCLAQAMELAEYARELQACFPQRFKLRDVIPVALVSDGDTRMQDRKDVERDSLYIGKDSTQLLRGSEIGYEAIVDQILQELNKGGKDVPKWFARALLRSANRTTSGGDAFETLQRHVLNPALAFIAPSSSLPMRISSRMGVFQNSKDGAWEYGLIARTESCTVFSLFPIEDVDRANALASLSATCVREFGLATPIVVMSSRRDDGRSDLVLREHACDGGGYIDIHCQVHPAPPAPSSRNIESLFETFEK